MKLVIWWNITLMKAVLSWIPLFWRSATRGCHCLHPTSMQARKPGFMPANGAMSDLIYRELADWPRAVGDWSNACWDLRCANRFVWVCVRKCVCILLSIACWYVIDFLFSLTVNPNPGNYYYWCIVPGTKNIYFLNLKYYSSNTSLMVDLNNRNAPRLV